MIFLKDLFRDGFRRCDPNLDIADAWNRLISNKYLTTDLDWFVHEYPESLIMVDHTIDWRTAHDIVNNIFKWET